MFSYLENNSTHNFVTETVTSQLEIKRLLKILKHWKK